MKPLRELSTGAKFRLANAVSIETEFTVLELVRGKHVFADIVACSFQHDGRTQFQCFSADLMIVPVTENALAK